MTLGSLPFFRGAHAGAVHQRSGLTAGALRPYPAAVSQSTRSYYFSSFFYYGFPYAGRDWRRTRE